MAFAGSVQLNPGRMVYFGTIGEIGLHTSVAIGLVLLASGRVELHDGHGRSVPLVPGGTNAAILPAGVPRAWPVLPSGAAEPAEVVMAIIDPATAAGRLLAARLAAGESGTGESGPDAWLAAAAPCWGTSWRPEPDDPAGARLADRAIALLADRAPAPPSTPHPAVRRAAALIPGRLGRGGSGHGVELRDLAATVGLSPGRLGRLFATELGLPYRSYVRWAQLQKVVDVLRSGGTLTDAAHAAGFTDSAHMNRVCRQVFGLNPSEMTRNIDWVVAEPTPR